MTDLNSTNRPWTPAQIMIMSVLFGALAGGVVTGINFKRMGKPGFLWPSMLIGLFMFLLVLFLVLYVIPEDSGNGIGLLLNVVIGTGFLLAQRNHFYEWKTTNWVPETEGAKYKANRIGLLILASLIAFVIEMGIIVLLVLGQYALEPGYGAERQVQRGNITFSKDARIFRLSSRIVSDGVVYESGKTNVLTSMDVLEMVPDVQDFLCFKEWSYIEFNDEFHSVNTYYANTSIFMNASVDLVMGNPSDALNEPNHMVLSESLANQLFGDADPFSKIIKVNGEECSITGVFMDLPKKSMIKTDVLVSYSTLTQKVEIDPPILNIYTDIILIEGHSFSEIEEKFVIYSDDILNDFEDNDILTLEIIANPIPVLNPEPQLILPGKEYKNLGFESTGVMVFPLPETSNPEIMLEFEAELMNHPDVMVVSGSSNPLFHEMDNMLVHVDQTDLMVNELSVGYNFIELMELELVEGRNFSLDYDKDDQIVLVNERFVKNALFDEPIGKTVVLNKLGEQGIYKQGKIVIGVVKDFIFPSNEPVWNKPLIITLQDTSPEYLFVKMNEDFKERTVNFIQDTWVQYFPGYPCRPIDLEEYLGR